MKKKTKSVKDQFREKGFLSQASVRAIKYIRQKNKEWFSLTDRFVFLLQEIAIRASESEAVKGTTLAAPALAAALALRSAETSQAAILLIERGMAVEARIMIRSLLENAFCIAALIGNKKDEFIRRFKEDHTASQKGQASFIRDEIYDPDSEGAKRLESFLNGLERGQNLNIKELAKLGLLKQQYLLYRILSNDSAHPSATSLQRHYRISPEKDGWNGYKMGVAEDREVTETLWHLTLSVMPICVGATEIIGDNVSNSKVNSLVEEYELLYARSKPQMSPSSN